MLPLKQSTVSTIIVGPVLDSTGSAYDSMTLSDFDISKNGANTTLTGATVTSISNGRYTIALTTGNTDTLGRLVITVNKSTYAMTAFQFLVMTSGSYDAIVTNTGASLGNLDASVNAVKAKTDNLPASPAAVGSAMTLTTGQLTNAQAATIPAAGTVAVSGDAMTLTSGERTSVAAAVWNALTAGITTANSIGKRLLDFVTTLVYSAPPSAASVASAVLTTQLTESYAADGSAPTLSQAVMLIQQVLTESSISGVTMTVKKVDGSTTAIVLTLNDSSAPTSITRSS